MTLSCMYEAKFEVEAITPIFMRGADQSQAEIRSSSIKGLMRWWFRALAGNYFGDRINYLKEKENEIFGSTGCETGITVEVEFPEPEPFNFDEFKDLSYLWFSIKLLKRKGQFEKYYPAGAIFEITLKSINKQAFKTSLVTLWTLISLGSIGFRSRRGAGSVKFVGGDVDKLEDLGLSWRFSSERDLSSSINSAISIIGDTLKLKSLTKLTPQAYPILNPKTAYVGLWNPKTGNPILALKKFQREYQNLRRHINKRERIVFGLPVKLRGKGTKNIRDVIPKLSNSRRSSPVSIGLTYIGRYLYVRIVKFYTHPYHSDSDIDKVTNWSILTHFNRSLSEKPIFGSLGVFEK